MPTLLHQNSNACPLTKYFLTHNTNTDTKYFATCNTNLDRKVNKNTTNNSLECRKMPPLIDQRWWPLTPVAIVWFTQYLEKSWENCRKSKAVHQIIFHADRNWKQKYHGFICHCSNTPLMMHREIFMFCQTFQLSSQLQINCNGAKCISPTEQIVLLHRKGVLPKLHNSKVGRFPKVWLIQSKLTEMQQIRTKSEISCFQLWKAQQQGMGLLCPNSNSKFELRLYKSSFHPLVGTT